MSSIAADLKRRLALLASPTPFETRSLGASRTQISADAFDLVYVEDLAAAGAAKPVAGNPFQL